MFHCRNARTRDFFDSEKVTLSQSVSNKEAKTFFEYLRYSMLQLSEMKVKRIVT